MATTTTNFGWDIPQSTDLVKDGATAIAALGQDIDTALVDLKGGTTGQVLAKASGTDLDFSWVAQDDSNAIQNAIVDAKGDLIAATANDTPARLAVGTNGHVLTADSTAATGIAWAAPASGGYTELATGTLSSSALSITSIPTGYRDLILVCKNFQRASGFDVLFQVNSDTGSNYSWLVTGNPSSVVTSATNCNSTAILVNPVNFRTSTNAQCIVQFFNYTDTAVTKLGQFNSGGFDNSANLKITNEGSFMYNSTSAISSIQTTATFVSGTYVLYGVK
jgi:hypothetical protein